MTIIIIRFTYARLVRNHGGYMAAMALYNDARPSLYRRFLVSETRIVIDDRIIEWPVPVIIRFAEIERGDGAAVRSRVAQTAVRARACAHACRYV